MYAEVVPGSVGLDAVVEAAQAGAVRGAGLARWSAVVQGLVGVDVVDVVAAGAPAPREAAAAVALLDLGAQPVRCFVRVDGDPLGHVDHGRPLDHRAGGEVAQPLMHSLQRVGAEPGDPGRVTGPVVGDHAADGVQVQVDVQGRRTAGGCPASGGGPRACGSGE